MDTFRLLIVTGMSGAGKTQVLQALEDMGYLCVDNIPPVLIPKLSDICRQGGDRTSRVALVVDIRGGEFFKALSESLDTLKEMKVPYEIVFMDATDETLIRRYKETRRSHPLAADGRILDGIKLERELLAPLKNLSQNVVDTTELTPRQLRKTISEQFSSEENQVSFRIEVMSFGFKYGLPLDADLVFDVRFLPNPYYKPELRDQTGLESEVYDYVMNHEESEDFYQHLTGLIKPILPGYQKEGKSVLTIAIGCTGGQHRSVAFAHRLAEELKENWVVNENHRDKNRRKETVNRS